MVYRIFHSFWTFYEFNWDFLNSATEPQSSRPDSDCRYSPFKHGLHIAENENKNPVRLRMWCHFPRIIIKVPRVLIMNHSLSALPGTLYYFFIKRSGENVHCFSTLKTLMGEALINLFSV